MPRVELPVTVLNGATGLPVAGAAVAITVRATGTPATWWTTETGGVSSTAAVITDSNGRALAWVDRGAYSLAISGTEITPYVETWDAVPASNGALDSTFYGTESIPGSALALILQQNAGMNGALVRRGKSIIAAEHTRTNTAYGKLGSTPGVDADQVSGIVLAADSLMFIVFQGLWKGNTTGTASAALHIGASPLPIPTIGGSTIDDEATLASEVSPNYNHLLTTPVGLVSSTGQSTDSTTPTVSAVAIKTLGGGAVVVRAPAGTYDVSVQFKAASGSVSAKERKLYVWSGGF